MKLLRSVLLGAGSAKIARETVECPPIESSSFWTLGHSKVSNRITTVKNLSQSDCTGTTVDSTCEIQCNPPYVSANALKPYEAWKVMCRKPANPVWMTSKWSNREGEFLLVKLYQV